MALRSYRDDFQTYLEGQIEVGGDVSTMVTLVNVYQGSDAIARQIAFREWVEATVFICALCGKHFTMAWEDVDEEDHILCPRCRRG